MILGDTAEEDMLCFMILGDTAEEDMLCSNICFKQ